LNAHTKQIWVVDVKSGKVRYALPDKGSKALAISPDGRMLAGADGMGITLWELASAKERGRIAGVAGDPEVLRFSPDGRCLAQSDYESMIHLFDVIRAQKVHTYVGHAAIATGLAFAPDGRNLASCSYDSTILVWDVAGVTVRFPKVPAAR
jgi:WD40 repeat protein